MGKKKQKQYKHIAERVFNTCLYLEPSYAAKAMAFLGSKMGDSFSVAFADDDIANHPANDRWESHNAENMGWMLRDDGTAVLRVEGSMYHGSSFSLNSSLGVGYNTIAANAKSALSDPNTQRLALLWESPGGDVNGCSRCANRIRDMADSAGVPMWSFVDEGMFSAGYWIGAQADRIIIPSTAATASVGVITSVVSYEKMLEKEGTEVTLITSGDKKAVGNPYSSISDEDYAELQHRVDKYASLFFDAVAEQRPLSVEQIKDAQANIFIGSEAVDQGFADEVMDIDDFFYAFSQEADNTSIYTGNDDMNKEDLAALQDKAAKADKLQEDVTALTDENKSLKSQLEDEKTAAAAKHDRYVAVMESEAAATRQEKAKEILADADFDGFSAEKLTAQLDKMEHDTPPPSDDDEDEDDDDDKDDVEEKEDSASMSKMLGKARAEDSDTKEITSKGSQDTSGGDVKAAEKIDAEPPKTAESHLAQMKRAAGVVKSNKSKRHI